MNVWIFKERKSNAALRELLGVKPKERQIRMIWRC